MPRVILPYVAASVFLLTMLMVSGAPIVTVVSGQNEPSGSCCYPAENHDNSAQPCDTAAECFCLSCLHIDLRQTALFFNRPLSVGMSVFPIEASLLPDFPQTIDYPPELS